MHFKKSLLILLSIGLSISLMAQRYAFRQYNVKQGLTHSQVRALMQDEQGYIWIGTLGGLSRFDGREFTTYGKGRGFNLDQIESLLHLSDGRVVAGSTGAFAIITNDHSSIFKLGQDFSNTAIQHMTQHNEQLWLATQAGIFRCLPDSAPVPWNSSLFGSSDIKHIEFLGDVALVLSSDRLFKVQKDKCITLYSSPSGELNDMWIDGDGTLWLASNGIGLIRIKDGESRVWNLEDGLVSNRLLTVTGDTKGTVWCGSRLGISSIDSDEELLSFSPNNGLPYAEIRDMLIDDEGNIWMGTDGGGIIRYLGDQFVQYTQKEGLPSDLVMTIVEDRNEELWLGSYDNGVYNLNSGRALTWEDGLVNDKVWTSLCDSRNRVWFGTSGGVSIVDQDNIINLTRSEGLPRNKVLTLFEKDDQTIWIGTSAGLSQVDIDLKQVMSIDRIPETKVRAICESSNGTFWIGTSSGVYVLNGDDVLSYSTEQGLASESVASICEDSSGRIWVGTKKGLNYITENGIEFLSLGEDYSSNFINFLLADSNGLLAGTNNGLFFITESESGFEFTNFSLEDGLGSLETNINAVHRDKEGNVWFGTTAGLMLHEGPFGLQDRTQIAPKIQLTDVRLNLNPTDWEEMKFAIDSLSGIPQDLELPFSKNHLTFHFTGIDHSYPEDVRYRYKLESFDEDWQPLTDVDFATYSNIPTGDFTFRVQSINKAGVWSDERKFSFTIKPPFYATWWFITLVILAISGVIYLIFKRRKERLIARLEKERLEMKSRMLGLEQQSLNSSMNRHFIFNALNSIQYYINRKDRLAANKYLSSFARLIRKNLDSSQQTFTSLSEELQRLELYLELEKMRFQDKFEYEIKVDDHLDIEQIKVPAMLLQPFLENSIWHGILPKEERGRVELSIESDGNGQILFKISDDGIGVDTSRSLKTEDGNHISKGMDISGGRLELITQLTGKRSGMNGPYELKDENGKVKGTEVTIFIPSHWDEAS